MKKSPVHFLAILIITILSQSIKANAFCPAKADTGQVKAALQKVNLTYGESFIKGDSSLFISCYAPDACILPANAPVICGVQGQLAFFKFGYKSGVRNIVFTTINLFGITGQYVTEQGAYEMFGAGNNSLGKGKYLVLWKKTAHSWKMFRDMFSSNGVPPAKK
jgi:ketosteroid isomerase-like protein